MTKSLLLLIACCATLIIGCSSDDGGTTEPQPDPENSFRLNGPDFADVLVATEGNSREAVQVLSNLGVIGLSSAAGTHYRLQVRLRDVAAGEFQIDESAGVTASLTSGTVASPIVMDAISGSVSLEIWQGEGGQAKGSFSLTLVQEGTFDTVTAVGTFDIMPITADPVNAIRADGGFFASTLLRAYDPFGSTIAGQSLAGDGVITMTTDIDGATGTLTITVKDIEVGAFLISQVEGNAASMIISDDGSSTNLFAQNGAVSIETWDGPGGDAAGTFVLVVSEGLNAAKITLTGSFETSPIVSAD